MKKILIPYWALCFLLTHLPPSTAIPETQGFDKLFHFAGYTLLGFLFRLNTKKTIRACLILFVYALLDEFTQPYVGRDFEWLDLLADGLGAIMGVILGVWLHSKIAPDE